MAGGLNLQVGGFGGVVTKGSPSYGSAPSYSSGLSPASAAFGGTYSANTPSTGQLLSPKRGVGLGFWMGVGSIVALWALRSSLPN